MFLTIMLWASAGATERVFFVEGETSSGIVEVGIDREEAIEGYINQVFGIPTPGGTLFRNNQKAAQETRRSKLTGQNAKIYDFLLDHFGQVARGELSSTSFNMPITKLLDQLAYTAADLKVDKIIDGYGVSQEAVDAFYRKLDYNMGLIMDSLLLDCPYELYWFDKTKTGGYNYQNPRCYIEWDGNQEYIVFKDDAVLTIELKVAEEYSVSDTQGTTNFNTGIASSILTAVQNARTIVSSNRGKADLDKLRAFKNIICDMTDYNDEAANEENNTPYGNPWQLIWVFDGNSSTKVVCEGYSKAFKYLCDESTFNTSISVSIVTGYMSGGTGAGGHMWNTVQMGNGKRYLVDVTNCDAGSIGFPDELFLVGYTDISVQNGNNWYVYLANNTNIYYLYDNDLTDVYSEAELTIEQSNLDPEEIPDAVNRGICGDNLTWQIAGGELTISGSGKMDDYSSGNSPWYDRTDLTTVNISGATNIGSYAFEGCTGLKTVMVSASVETIGENVFAGCTAMDVYYSGSSGEWAAILDASDQNVLRLPSSLEAIEVEAFVGIDAEAIIVPDSCTRIEARAFENCQNLLYVWLPKSLSPDPEAFDGCGPIIIARENRK